MQRVGETILISFFNYIISVDAMESRVYLYMGKWQETYNSAEKVLSQKSSLEDFNKENSKIPNDFQSTEVITV